MSSKKQTGLYSGADPTAPGGMSQQALADELMTKHGWADEDVKRWRKGKKWRLDAWTEMIDRVVYERGHAEREAKKQATELIGVMAPLIEDIAAELDETDSATVAPENQALFIGMPGTKDYIFDGHYGASPSGSERWLHCTASLAASRAFLETLTPNQQAEFARAGTAARQGTTAHAAAEAEARVMLGQMDEAELDSMLLELSVVPDTEGEAYDDEMAEYITEYTDLVRSYIQEGREVLIEKRLTATIELMTVDADGEYHLHDIIGSADLAVMPEPEHPVPVVGDLKYGEGVEVEAEENSQIRIYGLGLLAEVVERYGELPEWLTEIEYVIAQPRLGGIKVWTESVDDLLDWSTEVLSPKLTEALGGLREGAAFNPGDTQCQWCPVRGSCPALAEQRIEQASELFDVIQETEYATGIEGAFPETETLDGERLGSLYAQIKGLVDIAKDMKEEVQRRLHRGENVPGFHLVNYTPPRYWTEDAAHELDPINGTEGVLSEAAAAALWTEKLVSPTQAEKLLGDDYDQIKHLVVKPDIRPVAAPENDRRKKWAGLPPEAMFTDLDEED